jgi:Ferritin-like domain
MNEIAIEKLDVDGALREAADRAGSRADLLRAAAAGGVAALAALALPDEGRGASAGDVDILNYALTLEYLQASFYTEAERFGALSGRTARAARTVGAVERAHVRALRDVLGTAAVKRPLFNFGGVTEAQRAFLKTAVAFEDLAVAAYKGQAARIGAKPLLAAAVSIHSVEARHAAWMRHLFGIVPAERAFDDPLSRPEVERIVASTRFIASAPTTSKPGGKPNLTG